MCDANCKNCETSSTNCLDCYQSSLNDVFYVGLSRCSGMCPGAANSLFQSFYFNAQAGNCQSCDAGCTLCSNKSSNCSKCNDGYKYTYFSQEDQRCTTQCPLYFYMDQAQKNCLQCSAPCKQCFNYHTNCSECHTGAALYHVYDNNNLATGFCKSCTDYCTDCQLKTQDGL